VTELVVYHSFADVPPDDQAPEDGDDATLAYAPWANPGAPPMADVPRDVRDRIDVIDLAPRTAPLTPQEAARRVVPHPRDLRRRMPPMAGYDVLALQRALATAKSPKTGKPYRPWGHFTMQFGKGMDAQVRAFQDQHGLTHDGVYGPGTHAKMAPYFDAYGIRLLNLVHVHSPAEIRLATLMSSAMVLYNRRGLVHYSQGPSRMTIVRNRLGFRQIQTWGSLTEDCSSSVTGLYMIAGLADPNGFGFDRRGYGYTGTLAVHGSRAGLNGGAPRGALYLYGWRFPYHHVTMAVGGGNVFSHGSEYGPRISRWNYRGDVSQVRVYGGLPT
jgi:peptidoglycan hydrolase-like protein with peptidoglycan-binding domain